MKKRTLRCCMTMAALPSFLLAQEAVSDSLQTNLQEVEITATRATEQTPIAHTNISKEQLSKMNTGIDFPYLVATTPSVVTTSDAGTGIGYTSLRIRGTDGTRINVTANGIPINDAESHNVFWVRWCNRYRLLKILFSRHTAIGMILHQSLQCQTNQDGLDRTKGQIRPVHDMIDQLRCLAQQIQNRLFLAGQINRPLIYHTISGFFPVVNGIFPGRISGRGLFFRWGYRFCQLGQLALGLRLQRCGAVCHRVGIERLIVFHHIPAPQNGISALLQQLVAAHAGIHAQIAGGNKQISSLGECVAGRIQCAAFLRCFHHQQTVADTADQPVALQKMKGVRTASRQI